MLLVGVASVPAPAESVRSRQWHLDAYGAEEIWQFSTGEDVTVAVTDSGVEKSNPDLRGQVLEGKDFASTEESGDEFTDYDGHGTGMADLIAGTGARDGGNGAFGLAPGAKILPVRVPGLKGGDIDMVEGATRFNRVVPPAIRYAADSGAKVIDLSLGNQQGPQALTDAVKYALDEGSLVFAAVGNSGDKGNPVEYPGATPGVVGVGAGDNKARHVPFSEHGDQVGIVAPGEDLAHACGGGTGMCKSWGTGDSTALASAAALLWSKPPDRTNNQVLRVMRNAVARTKENAEVMQKVVERYGDDPKYMHEQPGIDDSLGKMGAAYVDELNRSLETDSDTTMEEKKNSPFGFNDAHGKSRFGSGFDTGLLWNRGDAVNFMGIVSQSETGHSTLSAAESLYTTSVLDQVGPKPGSTFDERDLTDARTTLRIGSEAQGIMDQSRMAQIDMDYEKDSEEHKKAVGRTTEWVKFGVGAAAAGGVAVLTGGAGGVLVPLAAETVGGAVTTVIGMEADDMAEKYEKDELLKKKSDALSEEALAMGKENSLRPGIAYANAPGWSEKDRNYLDETLVDYVRDARLHARDNSLPDPYEKK
ncbi:S8 family serine peptidase [Streptomyces sp. NPDC004284]|uniref:S8 family serine peptidase n=1 Tax=Streptomyces sp. NPDC004284 TaxID=3364695 RepID=UPI0036A0CE79